ncbi:transketolase [Iamia majanohamensis]|uniref:Transketolase n=1 Tax=Iamia majanohamensis TaxID=467976 RepID=A0AAE9Y8T4_9ACTN|nr:transketolase [Iamia majanohamensis]WCO69185.1 transketolase [Iamia majanohamensis]
MTDEDLEQRAINVIRGLSMDMPLHASSGHQGTAMALAPLAHVLWTRVMKYDASSPHWVDRDRFVLSCGHASVLQYSMLHLTGYGLTLDDLEAFRSWGSATPGHPEVHHTAGIEVTTGPLGQGIANAVGLALAERWLRATYGPEVVDHHTWAIVSDGDLMEGISHEAASFAGHLGLGRLIAVYDDNHISIDGTTDLTYSDDVPARFRAYGWEVLDVGEVANDLEALEGALQAGKADETRPTLIVVRSHVAYPSPNHTDDPAAHGNALDAEEVARTKELMGLPPDEIFHVPDDVLELYREAGRQGADAHAAWQERFDAWDGDKDAWAAAQAGAGREGWADALPSWDVGDGVATRKASGACFQALLEDVPGLIGGGADLSGNTGTQIKGVGVQAADEPAGRQIYFGIREHAMAAVMNGMALHGGCLPVGGTFMQFSDYCRPAVRLAALSEAKVIFSFTHDSVGLGEDGPTHQPVEHLMALRAIPGLRLLRPADANETAAAWRVAVGADGPTALALSRQDLPVLEGTDADGVARGAYVLDDDGVDEEPDLVLLGTGSEVHVCVEAAAVLRGDGRSVRVVSMPSLDLFDAEDFDYQESVLPAGVPTLAVEAGVSLGWDRWSDASVSIDRFGVSAPGEEVLARMGFTAEEVAARAEALLSDLDEPTAP